MDAPSATKIAESDLLRWLISGHAGRILIEQLKMQPLPHEEFELATAKLCPGKTHPGDIDLLLVPDRDPARSFAFEFKRITITPESFHTGLISRLEKLKHGVSQANALRQLGFSRAYLLVSIVTDAREQGGFWLSGPTATLIDAIDRHPAFDRLSPGVGLAFIEATQPVDRPIDDAGNIGVRIERRAKAHRQPVGLTRRIRDVFERRDAEFR